MAEDVAREGPSGAGESSLRVLIVCGADFRGPSEKVVLGYSLGLVAAGHEVLIAVRGEPETIMDELLGSPPPALQVTSYGFRGPSLERRFLKRARAFGPDVIHAYHPRLPVIKAAAQLAGGQVPVVVNFEDDEWGLASGAASGERARKAARRAALPAAAFVPALWPYTTRSTMAWVKDKAAILHAITPELARFVSARLDRSCEVLLPVRPDHALESVDGELPKPLPSGRNAVFTGAIFGAQAQDFRLLLKAVGLLNRRGKPTSLVFAGAAAPRFDLDAWAREAGLPPEHFVGLGYLDPGQLERLLRDADVLVQPGAPSRFNRLRLPSKLQAYLGSGTPTVTFAIGAGELFVDRQEVLKTHTGEPAELADRIDEAIEDTGLRQSLTIGGPQAAARLFDRRRNTDRLIGIYREAGRAPHPAKGRDHR